MISVRRAVDDNDWHEAVALLRDHVDWMRASTEFDPIVEQPSLLDELQHLDAHYSSGGAALFLASLQATVVGTVAVRCGNGSAELKRMFVRQIARGHGVADRLVDAVVDFAYARGCRDVWLETVRGPMDPAISVYRRNGFVDAQARTATLSMPGVLVMERRLRSTGSGLVSDTTVVGRGQVARATRSETNRRRRAVRPGASSTTAWQRG